MFVLAVDSIKTAMGDERLPQLPEALLDLNVLPSEAWAGETSVDGTRRTPEVRCSSLAMWHRYVATLAKGGPPPSVDLR